jgi:hypothetical protein
MAVNVSATELRDEGYLNRPFAMFSETGLDSISRELTKSVRARC